METLTNPEKLTAMLQVIFGNLLLWLVAIQTALTWAIGTGVLDAFPTVVEYAIVVLGVLGVAITFIRRVTPVEKEERGILPVESVGNDH